MHRVDVTADVDGHGNVLTYSGVDQEYHAMRRRAIVVDRRHRARMRFEGAKTADVLTGLVTNDVNSLAAGQGHYAAALTPKGKVIADMRVLRLGDAYLTDVSSRARDGWFGTVKKFVNPRLAKYTDVSTELSSLGIFGSQARYVMEELTGVGHTALALLGPYDHVTVGESPSVTIMRSPELGLEGYEIFMAPDRYEAMWEAAVHARATPAGLAAWEVARVEAGRPEWGKDMDDSTIPQEANLEQLNAISFTKGCYTGQEVVARVHFRGHVNRTLRGLRAIGGDAPSTGATLFDATGKAVGDVRTSVKSPRHGAIALGMVRLEVENGAQLLARMNGESDAAGAQVDVVALPFPAD